AGCHVGLLLDWFCFDFRRLFWFVGGYKPGLNERVHVDALLGFVNVAWCTDAGADDDVHGFS
ncbi:MAG: hypothetical protein EBR30_25605, partial [Cytophagia bacterium]|nr:hypothetical protein [Cytophagia bacterium]